MLAAAAIVLAYVVNHPIAILLGFTVMAAGVYSAINVFWTVPSRILSGVGAAAGIGIINSIGNLSGFGGTYFTGFIVGKTGSYAPAFLTIAGAVFLGGLGFIVLLGRRGTR